MTILSGYSSSLPTDVILGSMVIYIGGAVAYGATAGEPTVNIPKEFRNLDFDGKVGIPIATLDRKVMTTVPSIEGTFIELNTTKALDLEPGSSSATVTSVVTITPGLYGEFLATGVYKVDVRAICRRGGGGIVAIEFPLALQTGDSITGSGQDKGAVKMKWEARQDAAAASLGVAPYKIKISPDIASLGA